MILNYIYLLLMTIIGSFASMFLKKSSIAKTIYELIMNYNFHLGWILYLLSAIINIIILKHLPYSVVLPLTSLTYIWVLMLSAFILKEKITLKKLFGILFIICGAIFIGL